MKNEPKLYAVFCPTRPERGSQVFVVADLGQVELSEGVQIDIDLAHRTWRLLLAPGVPASSSGYIKFGHRFIPQDDVPDVLRPRHHHLLTVFDAQDLDSMSQALELAYSVGQLDGRAERSLQLSRSLKRAYDAEQGQRWWITASQ
jgi:hypothetical protein